jgi:hypothetical protein
MDGIYWRHMTGRESGGGVAGRRHDHYYYPLFFCLDIGREEGMEGRKGAFTAMLDTRTLGVGGTGIGGTVDVRCGGRGSDNAPAPRAQQHTHAGRRMWIAR